MGYLIAHTVVLGGQSRYDHRVSRRRTLEFTVTYVRSMVYPDPRTASTSPHYYASLLLVLYRRYCNVHTVSMGHQTRYGGAKKRRLSRKPRTVQVYIDTAPASRVVFVPDITGHWHKSDLFDSTEAYKCFITGVMSTALSRDKGLGQAPLLLLWFHSCLLGYLYVPLLPGPVVLARPAPRARRRAPRKLLARRKVEPRPGPHAHR